MKPRYIDIHSHVNDKRYADDLPEVLTRMRAAGVASVVVGTDRNMSESAIALAKQHDDLWATIGQHPTDNHAEDFNDAYYEKLAAHPRVVAIGECGLDYHWPSVARGRAMEDKPLSEKEFALRSLGEAGEKKRQQELFERQIVVAEKSDKPLMIHGRPTKGTMDAYNDILEILKHHQDIRGDVHFFVGDTAIAKQFLDLGFAMSFTGVLTFTHDYDDVVRYLPVDRIMAETDAPYVAPAPYRGKRNEPEFVVEIVKAIAKIRNNDEEHLRALFLENARRIFKLGLH